MVSSVWVCGGGRGGVENKPAPFGVDFFFFFFFFFCNNTKDSDITVFSDYPSSYLINPRVVFTS